MSEQQSHHRGPEEAGANPEIPLRKEEAIALARGLVDFQKALSLKDKLQDKLWQMWLGAVRVHKKLMVLFPELKVETAYVFYCLICDDQGKYGINHISALVEGEEMYIKRRRKNDRSYRQEEKMQEMFGVLKEHYSEYRKRFKAEIAPLSIVQNAGTAIRASIIDTLEAAQSEEEIPQAAPISLKAATQRLGFGEAPDEPKPEALSIPGDDEIPKIDVAQLDHAQEASNEEPSIPGKRAKNFMNTTSVRVPTFLETAETPGQAQDEDEQGEADEFAFAKTFLDRIDAADKVKGDEVPAVAEQEDVSSDELDELDLGPEDEVDDGIPLVLGSVQSTANGGVSIVDALDELATFRGLQNRVREFLEKYRGSITVKQLEEMVRIDVPSQIIQTRVTDRGQLVGIIPTQTINHAVIYDVEELTWKYRDNLEEVMEVRSGRIIEESEGVEVIDSQPDEWTMELTNPGVVINLAELRKRGEVIIFDTTGGRDENAQEDELLIEDTSDETVLNIGDIMDGGSSRKIRVKQFIESSLEVGIIQPSREELEVLRIDLPKSLHGFAIDGDEITAYRQGEETVYRYNSERDDWSALRDTRRLRRPRAFDSKGEDTEKKSL